MSASIFWYPDPLGPVREIDLGSALSDLDGPHQTANQTVVEARNGAQFTQQANVRISVRVVVERFTDTALRRELEALINHLKRGGLCGLAEDRTKIVGGYCRPVRGTKFLTIDEKPFGDWNSSAALVAGDEVVVMSDPATGLWETKLVSGFLAGARGDRVSMTGDPVMLGYSGVEWGFIRHYGFYPFLRMSVSGRNQNPLSHDHRISYTLNMELEEAPDAYENMRGRAPFRGTSESDIGIDLGGLGLGGLGNYRERSKDL